MDAFRMRLEALINEHSMENVSNTPDWILADYITDCLKAFDKATKSRSAWHHGGYKEDPRKIIPCMVPDGAESKAHVAYPHCTKCSKVLEDCGCDGLQPTELR